MEEKDKKALNPFEATIKSYLEDRATKDELFAKSYAKEGKTIQECCKFIMSEVKKTGRCGFSDDEIFGIAVHYYDEDNIGKIENVNARVVVNHEIQLTDEEKAAAKARAIAQFEREEKQRIEKAAGVTSAPNPAPKPKSKPKPETKKDDTPSLFDLMEDEA